MKIKNRFLSIVFSAVVIATIISCYSYGPIHKPYDKRIKTKEYKENYINKTYIEATEKIAEGDIENLKESIKILFPNHIVYHSNEYIPTLEFATPLKKLAQLLNKFPETNILVTGYSDNDGSDSYNKKISVKRADFIKKYLVEQGVRSTRIESWGLGELSPIASNKTDEGKSKNRRVEFIILYDDK